MTILTFGAWITSDGIIVPPQDRSIPGPPRRHITLSERIPSPLPHKTHDYRRYIAYLPMTYWDKMVRKDWFVAVTASLEDIEAVQAIKGSYFQLHIRIINLQFGPKLNRTAPEVAEGIAAAQVLPPRSKNSSGDGAFEDRALPIEDEFGLHVLPK